jgi:hypothetical protein
MHSRVRPVRLRKRVAEGPRASYPSRGWGSCGGIVMGVSLGPSPDRQVRPQRRSLQPAVQRSHDERCPSGSGRGKSSLSTSVRACEREGDGGGASRRCPLARETSTSTVHGFGRGFGSDRTTRRRCPYRTQGLRSLLTRHGAQASTRPCSRMVTVAEVDERRSAMEGVLIRPQASSLTRRRRSQIERPEAKGMRQRCRIRPGAPQRTSEATSRARYPVDNTASGRCSAEEPSIGAPPGPHSTPHALKQCPALRRRSLVREPSGST